jgi:L-ascorbate metabolism protein UlaG (beta-lactamase superfamily)
MKHTWHGHYASGIKAGEARVVIDPFLSDIPSGDNGWGGYFTGKNSTQGGDR